MRIGIALISQESNTFNPESTTIERFASYGIHLGDEVVDHADRGQVAGHLAAAAERGGVETVPIVAARSVAGGRVGADALAVLTDHLVTGLAAAGPLDGLVLQLHGACAAEGIDDVEGHLLRRVRDLVGLDLPIGLGLDHHANLTAAMVDLATIVVGHRTQPHDLFDTGVETSRLLFRVVASEVRPTMAWRKLPLLAHQEQFLTAQPPMKTWFDAARDLEADGSVLSASTFPMQPWLDVEDGGWSVLVVTDDDAEFADASADALADLAWSLRDAFQVTTSVPVAEAVATAAATPGLVVLSDTGDSVRGGAGGDSTVLLAEFLAQGVSGALITLVQPDIGDLLSGRVAGDRVSVTLGGAVAGAHAPITVEGTLRRFEPMTVHFGGDYAVASADQGWTAVLEVACGHVVVSERTGIGGVHPDLYPQVGLDPTTASIAVVKTASNFQYFLPLATDLIRVDTPGPTQSDIRGLDWERVPRPIHPLDEGVTWP